MYYPMGLLGGQLQKFIKLDEVKLICGMSRSSIYRGMNEGTFPDRIKISKRRIVWDYESIQKWMNQCMLRTNYTKKDRAVSQP